MTDKEYKVLVTCLTYNQGEYVQQTLEGFVAQKTNFNFVVVVIDDCSTDNTQIVIREYEKNYPDKIKGIYLEENYYSQNKSKTVFLTEWRKKSIYEAYCEGDDYWTDPYKLQKQVDYMDGHPKVTYTCHRYMHLYENTGEIKLAPNTFFDEKCPDAEAFEFNRNYLFQGEWITQPMTSMIRIEKYDENFIDRFKIKGAKINAYQVLSNGSGALLPFVGAVYRHAEKGIFDSLDKLGREKFNYCMHCELYKNTHDSVVEQAAIGFYTNILKISGLRYPKTCLEMKAYLLLVKSTIKNIFKKII